MADKGRDLIKDLLGKHSDLDRWKKRRSGCSNIGVYCDGGVKTPMQLPTRKWTV
jgi:hypothetical protein